MRVARTTQDPRKSGISEGFCAIFVPWKNLSAFALVSGFEGERIETFRPFHGPFVGHGIFVSGWQRLRNSYKILESIRILAQDMETGRSRKKKPAKPA
jgi:hypothetical protein